MIRGAARFGRRAERGFNSAAQEWLIPIAIMVILAVVALPSCWEWWAGGAETAAGAAVPPPAENEADSAARTAAAAETAAPCIARAVRWLEAQQRADGSFPSPDYDRPGATAMVCWMLLEATGEARRPSVARGLAWLREHADPERAATSGTTYGTYDAACTLVALFHHYRLTPRFETSPRIRKAVTRADRALIRRLAAYVASCGDAKGWRYRTDVVTARPAEAPLPAEADAAALRDPAAIAAVAKHHRIYWGGDNSNAGYGWLALRAASLLGVRAVDDAFVAAELERMLATRITTGEQRPVRVTRRTDGHPRGFAGFWPSDGWEAEAHLGGWSYAHGQQIPAMTAGTVASLVYCWQEASERGLLEDVDRHRAAAAVLGGLGSLRAAADPNVFCLY